MPLYEYHCSKCGKNFDVIQKFSDAPLATHEECGGAVEKLMSAPSFHLKGSGWYVTEYGKGGKVPDGKTGETKAKPGDSKAGDSKADASPSTESKPETKTESKPEAAPAKSEP